MVCKLSPDRHPEMWRKFLSRSDFIKQGCNCEDLWQKRSIGYSAEDWILHIVIDNNRELCNDDLCALVVNLKAFVCLILKCLTLDIAI